MYYTNGFISTHYVAYYFLLHSPMKDEAPKSFVTIGLDPIH